MGPAKWSYFYLYVILDIFSRRVVGWCVADAEDTALFKALFDETFARHDVPAGQLTLHADRGGPMKAKATALLLADLGVTKSHSRPHTSNDNPFSEAHFRPYVDGSPCQLPIEAPPALRSNVGSCIAA
jgi:putative transposase